MRHINWPQDQRLQHTENQDIRGDPERQGKDGGERKAGRTAHLANSNSQVLQQAVQWVGLRVTMWRHRKKCTSRTKVSCMQLMRTKRLAVSRRGEGTEAVSGFTARWSVNEQGRRRQRPPGNPPPRPSKQGNASGIPHSAASSPVDDCAALPVQAIVNELFGETRRIRAKLLFLQLDAGL